LGKFAFFRDMKKSHFVALVSILIALLVFAIFYFYMSVGPSSDKAMISGCVEYIMDEYGATNNKSKTWSNYHGKEADLVIPDHSAVSLCEYFNMGYFSSEKEARKALLKNCTYEIRKVEFIEDLGIVTVDLNSIEFGDAVATFNFSRHGGSWSVDSDSVLTAVLAGHGIGGSGNVISDIFKSLHS